MTSPGSSGSGSQSSPGGSATASPHTSGKAGGSGSASATSGTFTAPAVTPAVVGWGSYQRINAHRLHVQVCAKKVGNVFGVGVEVFAYNSDYSLHGALASVILPETPGGSTGVCTQTNLLFTAHLKVFTFIGQGGTITQRSSMKSIF